MNIAPRDTSKLDLLSVTCSDACVLCGQTRSCQSHRESHVSAAYTFLMMQTDESHLETSNLRLLELALVRNTKL